MNSSSMYKVFLNTVNRVPNKRAIVSSEGAFTWEEVFKLAKARAVLLKRMGVKQGDIVAFNAHTTVSNIILNYALAFVGAVIVNVDFHRDIKNFVRETGVNAKFLIEKEIALNEIDINLSDEFEYEEIDGSKLSFIIYTSGSTDKPKGVMLSQKTLIKKSIMFAECTKSTENDVEMLAGPLYHCIGIAQILSSAIIGMTLAVPESFSPKQVAKAIQQYGGTIFTTVPTLFLALCKDEVLSEFDLSSIRSGIILGGPYTQDQFAYIESRLNMTLCCSYGQTESASALTYATIEDDFQTRLTTVGRFVEGVEAKIEENGELVIKSADIMLGYYDDKQATEQSFTKDGYLRTGDMVEIDANGYVKITGRIKDVIIRAGENISSGTVEKAILSLNNVSAAAVVGLKSEYFGEVPAAMVVCGAEWNEEKLKDALKEKVRKIEMPVIINVVNELPLNSVGKIDKIKIKNILGELWKA